MTTTIVLKLVVLFGVLFVAMALRFPFFLACFTAAGAYAVFFPGSMPSFVFAQTFVNGLSNQTFAAIIFYFFLGSILNCGGLGDRMVRFGNACIGHLKGGLSHINIVASVIFAGVSGSAVADTASVGNLMIPMMKKQGYDPEYSAAVTQMSSIIGPIIPPSTTFVMLASMMDLSVRRLFLCGLVPGIFMGLVELAYSIYISHKRNYPSIPFGGWKNVWVEFKENFWALILPVIIIYCLTAGVGTVTEIGAVSCIFALFIAIVIYREMDLKAFLKSVYDTARQICTTLAMLAGATVFVWIIGTMNFSAKLANSLAASGLSPTMLFMLVVLLIFVLGMVLETSVITLVFMPVLAKTLTVVGIDPYVFAVVGAIITAVGLNTPPVGGLLYLTARIADTSPLKVFRESLPFVIGLILLCLLMIIFPQIVTFYPSLVL